MSDKYDSDGSLNENWLAKKISEDEGKKEESTITQIKEVLRITLKLLADEGYSCVLKTLEKHK